jgi:hypothetical protein
MSAAEHCQALSVPAINTFCEVNFRRTQLQLSVFTALFMQQTLKTKGLLNKAQGNEQITLLQY